MVKLRLVGVNKLADILITNYAFSETTLRRSGPCGAV
jgi:hypothetical protein